MPQPHKQRKLDATQLEQLLVCGEEVQTPEGQVIIHYPSCRELARRFQTAHSTISKFARDRDCFTRRERLKAELTTRIEQKLTERRADALSASRAQTLVIIDSFMQGFAVSLEQGQVRLESVADFNTMVRLREFLVGGADQRTEVQGNITLEALQSRYQRWLTAAPSPGVASTSSTSSTGPTLDDDAPAHLERPKGAQKQPAKAPNKSRGGSATAPPTQPQARDHTDEPRMTNAVTPAAAVRIARSNPKR